MAYGRFTENAQNVIITAQKESQNFKHGYIGTEHILLGILFDSGYGKQLLLRYGVEIDRVRNLVEDYIGMGDSIMPNGELLLTPRTKRLFDESFVEAKKFGHIYVSPEHLLLALINQEDGVAYTILSKLSLDINQLKAELSNHLSGKDPDQIKNDSINTNKSGRQNTRMLNKYSRDFTQLALEGLLDPVVGRKEETERVLEILCRRIKNNPCLIGEPGVGKTAVIEGLAQRIAEGDVPDIIEDKRLISLDISSMVAGAKYRGEFEERLKKVMEEIKENKNIIVFIDEIHTIIGAGGAEGSIDAANILKPALARGEIQCIGATTIDEYRKNIEKDSALERRFQPITVEEPSNEDTLLMLKGLRDKYEEHHGVKILDEALEAAVEFSDRYISDRFMPDKAIDLMDEAAAKLRINKFVTPPKLKYIQDEIDGIVKEKQQAIAMQDFEKAARLRDREKDARNQLVENKKIWRTQIEDEKVQVTRENIAKVVSAWTKIPIERLSEKESEKLINLEDVLHKRVVGQEEAIKAIAKAVRRSRVGLRDPNRPIGSFMFLGPTGVGKTELSKALAEAMFLDEKNIIRIDMSEYMEKHSVSKLIGSPPGYVGYEDGGQLTEAVRRKPFSVILLDEIEKANPDVFNILLQIMEDGRLTDSKGKVINFKNTIIIMTSNVGAHTIKKQRTMGFNHEESKETDYEKMKENIMKELKDSFKPEFLNRVDETIVFHKLDEKDMLSIVDIMLKSTLDRLKENNINLKVNDKCRQFLISKGNDLNYGARPLRRIITREIEDKLSEDILMGKVNEGDRLSVTVGKNGLIFRELAKK